MAKKPDTPRPPRPVQAPRVRTQPRESGGVNRRWLVWGAAAVVVIGAAIGLGVALTGGKGSGGGATIKWSAVPNLQTGPPPWPAEWQQLPTRLKAVGLDQLSSEGAVEHIHQYLDLWVNGTHVTLPPDVGIYGNSFITELHVHQGEPNIIHVESPTKRTFHLGQVFGEWGVRLNARCVGNYCGNLHWWVNGVAQSGNPESLALKEHQVIVIAVGKPPATIKKTYSWKGL